MRTIVSWTVRNMPAMNTLVLSILLVGGLSFMSMRREVFPEFDLEIVLVTVRTWPAEKLNCSVPLSVTLPETVAPSFRSTVSPGSIVPPV